MQGLIEEENVDSFNAPYYAPWSEELRMVVEKEGSFMVDHLEGFEIDWDGGCSGDNIHNSFERGQRVAKTVRAVVESMLESHFGNDLPMDDLFRRYGQLVGDYLSKNETKYVNLVVSLTRKDHLKVERTNKHYIGLGDHIFRASPMELFKIENLFAKMKKAYLK